MAPNAQMSMVSAFVSRQIEADISPCHAQARHVEMEFTSTTSRHFLLKVLAPTTEKSPMLYFPAIGVTQQFTPSVKGCGHGKWMLEVYQRVGHRYRLILTESMHLDGVGTLCFIIGDDLRPIIVSRLWLRRPSNGCGMNIKA